ncbi:MAG: hypothetical protein V8R63_06925 [Thomasclavelia ramosa]
MTDSKTIQDPTNPAPGNDKNGKNAGHSLLYVGSSNDTAKGQEYIYARNDDKVGSYSFVTYKAIDGTEQYLGVYCQKDMIHQRPIKLFMHHTAVAVTKLNG